MLSDIKMVLKKASFIFLAIILALVIIDLFLRLCFFVIYKISLSSQYLGPKENTYYYVYTDRPSWVSDYLKEDRDLRLKYYAFYEWRREGFTGKCINISAQGIRKTWNPVFENTQKRIKVFCLGGSAMWGVASRDDFTIPSLLSKRLNKDNSFYEIFNYAELSYTLPQEIMYLVTRLKEGDIPDIVIFLDGVNDVFAAFDSGEAGSIVNLNALRSKLMKEELSDIKMFFRGFSAIVEDGSGIRRIIKSVRNTYFPNRKKKKKVGEVKDTDRDLDDLATKVALDYQKNIALVDKLSHIYGFKYVFFLQPLLPVTKQKTAQELSHNSMKNAALNTFYQDAYSRIEEVNSSNEYFYGISDIFDNKTKTMYIDICHTGEEGNELIVEKMLALVKHIF